MNNEQLKASLFSKIIVGDVFENPGGGISKVVSVTNEKNANIRGTSRIYLPIQSFLDVCAKFESRKCISNDLKKYQPRIFDSNHSGHGCNCTFLFCIAEKLKLLDGGIKGKGVRGNPFFVVFK
jgi:hypothetical protein